MSRMLPTIPGKYCRIWFLASALVRQVKSMPVTSDSFRTASSLTAMPAGVGVGRDVLIEDRQRLLHPCPRLVLAAAPSRMSFSRLAGFDAPVVFSKVGPYSEPPPPVALDQLGWPDQG